MKKIWAGIFVMACATSPAFAQSGIPQSASTQSADKLWDAIFNSQTSYYSWKSTAIYPPNPFPCCAASGSSKGQQVFNPFGLQINGKPNDDWRLEALVRSGYVWSRQTSGAISGEYSGFTDTTVGATVTYNGFNGVQPFASINVNLPTGETVFRGSSTFAKADSDVVKIPSFGEGLNIGPTLGINIALNSSTIFSTGIGYTMRGPFDRDGDLGFLGLAPVQRMDPGDVLTGNASIAYRGERLSMSASISYSTESTTTRNSIDFYKAGDRIFAAAGIGYAWTENWASTLTGSFSHFSKNKNNVGPFPAPLVLEPFNTNSDVTTANFDTTYTQGGFSIGPSFRFLYRSNNAYNPLTFAFLPSKTLWSAGAAAQYAVTNQASFNFRVERMWLHEHEKPLVLIPNVYTDAWLVTLGGILKF